MGNHTGFLVSKGKIVNVSHLELSNRIMVNKGLSVSGSNPDLSKGVMVIKAFKCLRITLGIIRQDYDV